MKNNSDIWAFTCGFLLAGISVTYILSSHVVLYSTVKSGNEFIKDEASYICKKTNQLTGQKE